MDINRHQELPLSDIGGYPTLHSMLRAWKESVGARGHGCIDPTIVPPRILPTVMLIELSEDERDGFVKLAGTFVCRIYQGELKGRAVSDFFEPDDVFTVMESLRRCVNDFTPSLAKRSYVSLDKERWEYVRLLLPERDGNGRKRVFKAMDRSTLRRLPGAL